jgi:hypothetical protein
MTDANNSGNNTQGGTITITGAGGGGGGNGQWITVSPGKQYTITIPAGAGGGGTCSTGGNLILQAGAGTCPQISFNDIDLAVPVDAKKEISDGCTCRKCKEYYQYAEPNQDDGTLICYGCRMVW